MRIIAFINDTGTVGKILNHIGESTQPPRIAPARGPPLWVAAAEQAENDRGWDSSAQSAAEIGFDQRIACQVAGMLAPDAWRVIVDDHSPGIRQCLGCNSVGIATHAGSKSTIDGCTRRQPSAILPGSRLDFLSFDDYLLAPARVTREHALLFFNPATGALGPQAPRSITPTLDRGNRRGRGRAENAAVA